MHAEFAMLPVLAAVAHAVISSVVYAGDNRMVQVMTELKQSCIER